MRFLLAILTVGFVASGAVANPVSLYGHYLDSYEFGLTPQAPPANFTIDVGHSRPSAMDGCTQELQEYSGILGRPDMEGRIISHPIDYDGKSSNLFAGDAGIGYDVQLDGDMSLDWYLSLGVAGNDGNDALSGPPQGNVRLQATAFASSLLLRDNLTVLAEGVSEPVLMVPGEPEHARVNGRDVFHFHVPLDVRGRNITDHGITLVVRPIMDTPCPEGAQALGPLGWHSSPDFRPALHLATVEPHAIMTIAPTMANGSSEITVETQTLFAAHPPVLTAQLTSESGALQVTSLAPQPILCHCYPHPMISTFKAELTEQPAGLYTWSIAANVANITLTDQTTLAWDVDEDASGPGPVLVLALVATAIVLRRRP